MKEAEASVLKEHVGKSWSQTTADALWRSAAAAGVQRHLPRLGAHDVEARRSATRLLRPPAQGPEGLRGDQSNDSGGHVAVRKLRGWTLARGRARGGDRVVIAAHLGGSVAFDRAILDFAELYAADQNERDYHSPSTQSRPEGPLPRSACRGRHGSEAALRGRSRPLVLARVRPVREPRGGPQSEPRRVRS